MSGKKTAEIFEIAINHGRIIDPLTGFDGAANIGVKDGIISAIVPPAQELEGKRVIDAAGLVVAPGFINIHSHSTDIGKGGVELYIRDGITTEVSGNCGMFSPVSFAAFADMAGEEGLVSNTAVYIGHNTLREAVGVADNRTPADAKQLTDMEKIARQGLKDGALGVSFGPFYGPGATYEEMMALAKIAAEFGGCCASHVRESFTPDDAVKSVEEGMRTAREAGTPLIISHTGGGPTIIPKTSGPVLEAIFAGLDQGLKLAMDFYGYDAFLTVISAPIFDLPLDTIMQVMQAKISDMEMPSTVYIDGKVFMKPGQRFETAEQFLTVRNKVKSKEIPETGVIGHLYKQSKLDFWMSCPLVMVSNDCTMMIDSATGKYAGHPKDAGTFAHFLGYWVRQRGVCDLRMALARTSAMAASFLGLDKKGRIKQGSDADIVIFDAGRVIDRSTYTEPGVPSDGIPFVLVNGLLAVENGKYTGIQAGKIIRRTWKTPGVYPNLGQAPATSVDALS